MRFFTNFLRLTIVVSVAVAVSSRATNSSSGEVVLEAPASIPSDYFALGSCYDHLTPDHFNGTNRNGIIPTDYLWPYGIIPYVFKSTMDAYGRDLVMQGMKMVEKKTCLKFVPRKNEVNYFVIKNDAPGCWNAGVGMRGGAQNLNLQPSGCYSATTAAHELLHGAGLWHEHARPDRDDYIVIDKTNLKEAMWSQYMRCDEEDMFVRDGCSTFGVPYNVHSIMHYPGIVKDPNFSKDLNKPIMYSKAGVDPIPSGLVDLTEDDTAKINKMYNNCAK